MKIFISTGGKIQIDAESGKIKVCGACTLCPDDCVKVEFNVVLSIPVNYDCYYDGSKWNKLIDFTMPASWKVTYNGVDCKWTVNDLGSYTIRKYNGTYPQACSATSYTDTTYTLGCMVRVGSTGWWASLFKDGNENSPLFYVTPISLGGDYCNTAIDVFSLDPVYGWMDGSGSLTFS